MSNSRGSQKLVTCVWECRMGRGSREHWEGTRNILYLHLGDGYRKERRKVGGMCTYMVKITKLHT